MKNWDEGAIALVFYSGLFLSLALGILVTWFLKSRVPLSKIIGRGPLWHQSFRSTLITAGLLGAMTVSFTGCDCSYSCLLGKPTETINLGIAQVKAASLTLAAAASGWLMILIIAQQFSRSLQWKVFLVLVMLFVAIVAPMVMLWIFAYT